MKSIKLLFYSFAIVLMIAYATACTYSSNYPPALNDKHRAILDSLNSKYSFEDVSLVAKKTSGSSGDHAVIIARFLNGKNIPADNDKMEDMAKQLAMQVKRMLKNPKEFETYTILFISSVQDGLETTTKTTGHDFSAAELK